MVPCQRIHLYLLVMISVQVEVNCFRTPLPYGTGYVGTNHNKELSDQGIGNHSAMNLRRKEAKVEGNMTARGYLSSTIACIFFY